MRKTLNVLLAMMSWMFVANIANVYLAKLRLNDISNKISDSTASKNEPGGNVRSLK